MKPKHYVPIIVIFIAVSLGAYFYTQQITTNSNRQQIQDEQDMNEATRSERFLDVRLVVSSPPQSALIVIYNNGNVHYQVTDPDIYLRIDSTTISQDQFNNLANLIINNKFWSFNERYFDENISLFDVARYTVLVKSVPPYSAAGAIGRVHKVDCLADKGCPEEIMDIINKIKELWGKKLWKLGLRTRTPELPFISFVELLLNAKGI